MTVCLNIQLKPGLYLLLKMHFVRQNYSLSAEEVLRAYVDAMHHGLRAQMIHGKKGTHACHLKSKNWNCTLLLLQRGCNLFPVCLKIKPKPKKLWEMLPFSRMFKNCPSRLLRNCFCCSNQQSTSYIAHRIAAVSISILQSHQWTVHP